MVIINLLIFLTGLTLLIKSADFFVEASSRLAKRLGFSEFLIGMTLVAIGTSIPELSSAITAAIKGDSGLIIGSIIGSNIANIGLILGLSAIFTTIKIKKMMIRRDALVMVFATVIFYLLAFNGVLNLTEGIILLLIYIGYMSFIISSDKSREDYDFKGFLKYFMKFEYIKVISKSALKRISFKSGNEKGNFEKKKGDAILRDLLIKDFLVILISLIGVIYGARFLVSQAIFFANFFGVSSRLIGFTFVAFGTSIPELSVAIRAAKKGFVDMVIGNILGSNIANILLVLGITAFIRPIEIFSNTLKFTGPFLIIISILLIYFMNTKKEISRLEGVVLLLIYFLFIIGVFVFGV